MTIIEKIEKQGWAVEKDNKKDIYIHKCSNAGEDFGFVVYPPYKENIKRYARDFDPEEHALSWVGGNGAPNIRVLLQDADEIKQDLTNLAGAL